MSANKQVRPAGTGKKAPNNSSHRKHLLLPSHPLPPYLQAIVVAASTVALAVIIQTAIKWNVRLDSLPTSGNFALSGAINLTVVFQRTSALVPCLP